MGVAASENQENASNRETGFVPVDIDEANKAYLDQFRFPESKEDQGFNFYAINSVIEEDNDDDIKQQHKNLEFEPQQSSRCTQQPKVKGLTKKHIAKFINHGGLLVNVTSSHGRLKNGRSLERSYHVSTIHFQIDCNNASKVKLIGTVKSQDTPNIEYDVFIILTNCIIGQNNEVSIQSIQNIDVSSCNCKDPYGDFVDDNHKKKCKHVIAMLTGVSEEYIPNLKLETGKNDYFRDPDLNHITPYYQLGDVEISLESVPSTYPGPQTAFAYKKSAYILKWLLDEDESKSNLAAILTWMYIGNGAINSFAHKCPRASCTKTKMKFDQEELAWICRGSHLVLNADGDLQHVQHTERIRLFEGSTFFDGFITAKQVGAFTTVVFLYLDSDTTVKGMTDKLTQIGLSTAFKWSTKVRNAIGIIRKRFSIKLGDNGSPIEIDCSFLGKRWKFHKMSMPHSWRVRAWFRIIERFLTPKGRHRRLTFIVGTESTDHCEHLLLKNIALNRQLPLFADGSTMCESISLKESTSAHLVIKQCNHSSDNMVKLGSEHLDALGKIHDNTCETSFQRDKLACANRYGLGGCDIDLAASWIHESDWCNNYTDMTTVDKGKTFIEQICAIFPARLPRHLWLQ